MTASRTTTRRLGLSLGALLLGGCPEDPPREPCSGPGDPVLTLANRGAVVDLGAGPEVEVFPPPQGGVFAELDVTIADMGISELEYLRVAVEGATTGEPLATVRYFGGSIPLRCTEDDEVLVVDNLPVGFVQMFQLDDLDGQPVVVRGSVETTAGDEFPVQYDATLVRTEY